MNKKAFTMIEVIAIIALLGIILVIALPNFFSAKDDINIKERQTKVELIINAGRQYLVNNSGTTVTVSTLCTEAYLQCPIIDPVDSSVMDGSVTSFINGDGELSYRYDN